MFSGFALLSSWGPSTEFILPLDTRTEKWKTILFCINANVVLEAWQDPRMWKLCKFNLDLNGFFLTNCTGIEHFVVTAILPQYNCLGTSNLENLCCCFSIAKQFTMRWEESSTLQNIFRKFFTEIKQKSTFWCVNRENYIISTGLKANIRVKLWNGPAALQISTSTEVHVCCERFKGLRSFRYCLSFI